MSNSDTPRPLHDEVLAISPEAAMHGIPVDDRVADGIIVLDASGKPFTNPVRGRLDLSGSRGVSFLPADLLDAHIRDFLIRQSSEQGGLRALLSKTSWRHVVRQKIADETDHEVLKADFDAALEAAINESLSTPQERLLIADEMMSGSVDMLVDLRDSEDIDPKIRSGAAKQIIDASIGQARLAVSIATLRQNAEMLRLERERLQLDREIAAGRGVESGGTSMDALAEKINLILRHEDAKRLDDDVAAAAALLGRRVPDNTIDIAIDPTEDTE